MAALASHVTVGSTLRYYTLKKQCSFTLDVPYLLPQAMIYTHGNGDR